MIDGPHTENPRDVELETHISREIGGMVSHPHVEVKEGVVTISGSAEDFESKRQIEVLVKGLAGKHQVVNQIRVASTSESFDNNR